MKFGIYNHNLFCYARNRAGNIFTTDDTDTAEIEAEKLRAGRWRDCNVEVLPVSGVRR